VEIPRRFWLYLRVNLRMMLVMIPDGSFVCRSAEYQRARSLLGLFLCGLLCLSGARVVAQEHEIVFDSSQRVSESRLRIEQWGEGFPTDWSGHEAIVIEMRASSPQRFDLKVYSGSGDKFSRVLVHPYPGAWVRAAIPVAMLSSAPATGHDMASVGNRSRPGYFLGLWGPFVPLTAVSAIGFSMERPIGSPRLEIRSLRLAKTSPGDAVLEPLPLVDEFGQWIPGDWPGKVSSLESLRQNWAEEAAKLDSISAPTGVSRYGGFGEAKTRATGFFRVEQIEGKWWFVDPEGHLFLSVGSDVTRPEMITRVAGREALFRELPPRELLGNRPGADPGASFHTWNLARRFGHDWRPQWVDFTLRRMQEWGLNTVANWSDPNLWRAGRKAYVVQLSWDAKFTYLGLPDVYSEEFAQSIDAAARRQCQPLHEDPWLLGYFLANEPPFPQKALQTVELILAGPPTATRQTLEKWLEASDTAERRKRFIDDAFDRYVQMTSAAVRKYDPNHLNLGMRSGGHPSEAEIRVSRAFDVYSVNIYNYQFDRERMKQITVLTGKPVIIGEFHFGVPGRGLSAGLVQVKNQHERGVAYRYYVEQAFSMPGLIGAHWFQWVDQPPTGRFDGENYNIGLVDVTDRPYEELVAAMRTTHQRLYQVHAGTEPPFSRRAAAH
jgi:hypothetical protein